VTFATGVGWLFSAAALPLPFAVGFAVLARGLYDIGRLLTGTLVYGLLTALLGSGYAGAVRGLGQLLGSQRSSLAVAVATLAVAAAFQPARRRIQALVDRRFNRRRYNATRIIEAFSARLRDEIDLDTLTSELLAVVSRTMEPTRVSLWSRPPAEHSAQQPAADPQGRCGRAPGPKGLDHRLQRRRWPHTCYHHRDGARRENPEAWRLQVGVGYLPDHRDGHARRPGRLQCCLHLPDGGHARHGIE
jgi:hypothetical protein